MFFRQKLVLFFVVITFQTCLYSTTGSSSTTSSSGSTSSSTKRGRSTRSSRGTLKSVRKLIDALSSGSNSAGELAPGELLDILCDIRYDVCKIVRALVEKYQERDVVLVSLSKDVYDVLLKIGEHLERMLVTVAGRGKSSRGYGLENVRKTFQNFSAAVQDLKQKLTGDSFSSNESGQSCSASVQRKVMRELLENLEKLIDAVITEYSEAIVMRLKVDDCGSQCCCYCCDSIAENWCGQFHSCRNTCYYACCPCCSQDSYHRELSAQQARSKVCMLGAELTGSACTLTGAGLMRFACAENLKWAGFAFSIAGTACLLCSKRCFGKQLSVHEVLENDVKKYKVFVNGIFEGI